MTSALPAVVLNKEKIPAPRVHLTNKAYLELKLILENDFTLAGKYFRVLISGKGCDGFTYATGFTDLKDDDFEVHVQINGEDFVVLFDPFAAFYLQECTIDYVQDLKRDLEGLVVINHSQEKYAGKFWREDESKIPPTLAN